MRRVYLGWIEDRKRQVKRLHAKGDEMLSWHDGDCRTDPLVLYCAAMSEVLSTHHLALPWRCSTSTLLPSDPALISS